MMTLDLNLSSRIHREKHGKTSRSMENLWKKTMEKPRGEGVGLKWLGKSVF